MIFDTFVIALARIKLLLLFFNEKQPDNDTNSNKSNVSGTIGGAIAGNDSSVFLLPPNKAFRGRIVFVLIAVMRR